MTLPPGFLQRAIRVHGAKGKAWVDSLPATIRLCEKRWQFRMLDPFDLSFNFVARVILSDDSPAVLKVCMPGNNCLNEINTLRYYDGAGMCRLLDSVDEAGVLLLERLDPGYDLRSVKDDDQAMRIASSLIRKMKQKKRDHSFSFPSVGGFDTELIRIRDHRWNRSDPFPDKFVSRVRAILHDLLSSQKDTYLLHGDLHHENIIADGADWKLIDPKGITGETEYEIIPFLINNLPDQNMEEVIRRRAGKFAMELDLNADRTFAWGLCHSVLAAWWNVEDNFGLQEHDLAVIEIFNKNVPRGFSSGAAYGS